LKEDFPPVSLPKREYMEKAKKIWEELGLPKLKPETPWYGYSLGEWNQDFDAMAARATAGDYFDNAESLERRRRTDVAMNTEVRRVDESRPSPRSSPKPRPRRR
jgi:4-hydroxy-3-polyprenylbenzoate decarboxylase